MSHPLSKIDSYIAHRIAGSDPTMAARLAGYSEGPGLKVAASRNETRADVREAIRKAKKQGAALGRAVTGKPSRKTVAARGRPSLLTSTLLDNDPDNPLEPWKLKDSYKGDPLALLLNVMDNPKAPAGLRIQCAKDAMPYIHARKEGTKGDQKKKASAEAAGGAFKRMHKPTPLQRVA